MFSRIADACYPSRSHNIYSSYLVHHFFYFWLQPRKMPSSCSCVYKSTWYSGGRQSTVGNRRISWCILPWELEGIISPCCLLFGQYPHHMTLCPPVAIVKNATESVYLPQLCGRSEEVGQGIRHELLILSCDEWKIIKSYEYLCSMSVQKANVVAGLHCRKLRR